MKISFVKEGQLSKNGAPQKGAPQKGVLVIPVAEGKTPQGSAAALDKVMKGGLKKAYAAAKFTGKAKAMLDMLAPAGLDVDRLIVVGQGKKDKNQPRNLEEMGGTLARRLQSSGPSLVTLFSGDGGFSADDAAQIAFGALLGNYRFDKYLTKVKEEDKRAIKELVIGTGDVAAAKKAFAPLEALAQGVYLARDLAHEPANVLYPESFAQRTKALSKLGVKVNVLGEAQMKKLGMGSLLGVGQGSVRESQLVVMKWDGGKAKDAPFAVVGKGVCFDTGGISLKPAGGMEDMKADMGGAACVTGLMHALAKRKAPVNVVGVIGLVENMPDGNAQRPGDIVTSMSGQTIEVLNTDAEGRLVLADALWYAQETFKPVAMVNFATLTGAILVALGQEYAGLFSNNDKLAEQLYQTGLVEGEKVWRLPMSAAYDKMIKSKTADMKNIGGGRYAGSITAAQFLQRFIKKGQAWAHVDIAGTAMGSPATATSPAWASGFGVRLINGLITRHYEKSTKEKSTKEKSTKK